MSVESDIFDALNGLVGGRVYPDEAPNGAQKPYIVYTQIGGKATVFLEGALPSKRNGRFQFNVWDTTRTAAAALARDVAEALVTNPALRAYPLGEAESRKDQLVNLYGTDQDFSIWFDHV